MKTFLTGTYICSGIYPNLQCGSLKLESLLCLKLSQQIAYSTARESFHETFPMFSSLRGRQGSQSPCRVNMIYADAHEGRFDRLRKGNRSYDRLVPLKQFKKFESECCNGY